ncbi:hypothetical protein I6A60_34880 [Frankia sp. AgB1.9]|uniref:hypothetical protein n=1 Tax=unclassified Frankia TaxID=2632575 RepID=UPI001932C5DF|nr:MULTISPECIES: hypothetical protein [unclassified Frankia]MBL7493680.1 hypothetical protein [Frankia sp. AgW1.1]MBL7552999.1 hypothetical protein [Frankia sp. AgB1.9]
MGGGAGPAQAAQDPGDWAGLNRDGANTAYNPATSVLTATRVNAGLVAGWTLDKTAIAAACFGA